MLKSIEGIFRNGKVELLEPAPHEDEARVVVTFLPSRSVQDLGKRGIDPAAAADLQVDRVTGSWTEMTVVENALRHTLGL